MLDGYQCWHLNTLVQSSKVCEFIKSITVVNYGGITSLSYLHLTHADMKACMGEKCADFFQLLPNKELSPKVKLRSEKFFFSKIYDILKRY